MKVFSIHPKSSEKELIGEVSSIQEIPNLGVIDRLLQMGFKIVLEGEEQEPVYTTVCRCLVCESKSE